ncbi:hypothetical protein LCGC14_1782200, partial [marine sediment metagenome]
ELAGFSGFNVKSTQTSQKFFESFWKNEWTLLGTQQDTITVTQDIKQDTKVGAPNPNTNYYGQDLSISKIPEYETYIEIEQSNYLTYGDNDKYELKVDLNNQIYDEEPWDYTGVSYGLGGPPNPVREDIHFYNGYWWLLDRDEGKVYKYNSGWSYTGASYDVSNQESYPSDIHFYNGYWWMVGLTADLVYKYNSDWSYTGTSYPIGDQNWYDRSIFFANSYWWVLERGTNVVYKYNSDWSYTGTSYPLGSQDTKPSGIYFHNGYWYMVGMTTDKVYKYNSDWSYTGTSYDVSNEDDYPNSLYYYDGYWWLLGMYSNKVYRYDSPAIEDVDVYSVGIFDETTLTWNNRPVTYDFLSKTVPTYPFSDPFYINLGDINIDNSYYRLKTSLGGVYFNQGPVVEYSIAKKHQQSGMLYMQTDSSEFLRLKSPVYTSNTTINKNDRLIIEFKTMTSNNINLTLLSGGNAIRNYTVVQEGNNDFTSQTFVIIANETIQFDQLMFTGALDEAKHFIVYSISITEPEEIETELQSYNFVEQNNKPYIFPFSAQNLTSPTLAHVQDNNYYTISSGLFGDNQHLSIEFEFDIPQSEIFDVERINIELVGFATNILLSDATFRYYNFDNGLYEPITPEINDDEYIFSIEEDQFYKLFNGTTYKIVFILEESSANQFIIHIDSLNLMTIKPWSIQQDLYKASFLFEKLGYPQTGNITIAINDDVYITLSDNMLSDIGDHTVSIFYDFNKELWLGYLDSNTQPIINITQSSPSISPRIESNYNSINDGILVKSIESQYYLRVQDSSDFNKYKSLIDSYKSEFGHTDQLQLNSGNLLLNPENLFSQVSADIDVIYTFHDGIDSQNIFSYQLTPTLISDSYDNLASYQFNETGFNLNSASSKDYYTVSSTYGNSIFSSGQLSYLNTDDTDYA